jgi:hypothetical protein
VSESKLAYGPPFQREVLRLMMQELSFAHRAAAYLEEGFFSGELRWFFRKFKDYVEKDKKTPTDSYMSHEILKHAGTSEGQKYESERLLICGSKPDADYLRRELTGWIRANIFVAAYKESAAIYNGGGTKEDAYDLTRKKLDLLQKVDFERERVTRFGDWELTLDSQRLQYEGACPTGILPFDQSLGGLLPQTWTTFLGSSSAGKSMIIPSLAYYNAAVGKRTFVTVHEDEEGPTKLRYLARFSGIRYNRLLIPRSELTEDEITQLKLADGVLDKYVVMRFMYGKECTVEHVQDAVRMQKREWDFQLFACDYGQCLSTSAFKSRDDTYNVQGYVYEQLKQVCLELDIAGVGGAQVNRTGHQMNKRGVDFLRMTDVGDSFGICRKSSNVITINRSDEDAELDRVVFLLDKARSGRAPIAVECVSDYARCATHIEPETQREIPVTAKARQGDEPPPGDDAE